MKRLRNSTKAIIIGIIVAVLAVTGVVTAIILNNRKNPAVPPVSPDEPGQNISYSYALTEQQKDLILDINADCRNDIAEEKGTVMPVSRSLLTSAGIVASDVIFFDGKYCITSYSGAYSAYVLRNGAFISVQKALADDGLIFNDITKVKIEMYKENFLFLSQEYNDASVDYVDYMVVSLGENLTVPKKYHANNMGDVPSVDGVSLNILYFKDFFMTMEIDGSEAVVSAYEFVENYSTYEGAYVSDTILESELDGLDVYTNGFAINYLDGTTIEVAYSEELGIHVVADVPDTDTLYTYRNFNFLQHSVKGGEITDTSVYIEEEFDGYYMRYSYEISFGDDELFAPELFEGYAKVYPIFVSEKYVGVLCQNVDEENILIEGGDVYYFDTEMNIVVQYEAKTSDARIIFSDGIKLFTSEGVYASNALVEMPKVLDFVEPNLSFVSVDSTLETYVVKSETSYYVVDVNDLLFIDGVRYTSVVSLGDGLYVIDDDESKKIFDYKEDRVVEANLNDFTNNEIMKKYGIYYVNNAGGGIDLYSMRDKLYSNIEIQGYHSNSVTIETGGVSICLFYGTGVAGSSNGPNAEVANENYTPTQNFSEVDNYGSESSTYYSLSWSISGNGNSVYVDFGFRGGIYPCIGTVMYIQFHRQQEHGVPLRMPIYISAVGGGFTISFWDPDFYSSVSQDGFWFVRWGEYGNLNMDEDGDSGNYDRTESHKVLFVKWTSYHKNDNVELTSNRSAYISSGDSLRLDFTCSVVNQTNKLTKVSVGTWSQTWSKYTSKDSDYCGQLYYKIQTHYIRDDTTDYAKLTTSIDTSGYNTYTTSEIKYNSGNHNESIYSGDTYLRYYIHGGVKVGLTDINSTSTRNRSYLYNETKRVNKDVAVYPISWSGSSDYINLPDGNEYYIYQAGALNTTRHAYVVFEPCTVNVSIVINAGENPIDNIVGENPTIKIYRQYLSSDMKIGSPTYKTGDSCQNADSKTFSLTMKYTERLKITAESDHYYFTGWTVTNTPNTTYNDKTLDTGLGKQSVSDNFSSWTNYTELRGSSSGTVTFTANWEKKTYRVLAKVWDYSSPDYKGFVYNEATLKIDGTPQKIKSNSAPTYYDNFTDPNSGTATSLTVTSKDNRGYIELCSFVYKEGLTLDEIYDGVVYEGIDEGVDETFALPEKYKILKFDGNFEFKCWGYLTNDTTQNVPGESAFADGCTKDVFTELVQGLDLILVAVYKQKPYKITFSNEPIGGSLSSKTESDKQNIANYKNESTTNNFFNETPIVSDYGIKVERSTGGSSEEYTTIFDTKAESNPNSLTGNTAEQILCTHNIKITLTLDAAYYFYKLELSNFILKNSSGKYYENTVTLTYNRSSWNASIANGFGQTFTKNSSTGTSFYFGSNEENVINIENEGNTVILTIINIANPAAVATNVNGLSALSGKDGFQLKMYADSVTADNNDLVIADSRYTSSTISSHTNENLALELAAQPLVVESSAKTTVYFWYDAKKFYLVKEFSGTLNIKEGFYLSASDGTGSSTFVKKVYADFLAQGTDLNKMVVYVQARGNDWTVLYPAKYVSSSCQNSTTSTPINNNAYKDRQANISFGNTRMIVIEPHQSKAHVTNSPSVNATQSSYYELNAFISKITYGVDNTVIFQFGTPTRNIISGSSYGSYGLFNLNKASSLTTVSALQDGIKNKKISYLGEEYVIHDGYRHSSEKCGIFYLYIARRTTDNYTRYFLLYDSHNGATKATYNKKDASQIVVTISGIEYSFSISDSSDANDIYAAGDSRYQLYKNNNNDRIYESNNIRQTLATSLSSYTFKAVDNNRFAIVPANGYVIKQLSVTVGGREILKFVLNESSFDNLMRMDYYTYSYYDNVSSSIIPHLTYSLEKNEVIRSDAGTYAEKYGVYYTYGGSFNWQTTNVTGANPSYNFNYIFLMIAGVYGDVSIDVKLASYVEFVFEDASLLLQSDIVSGGNGKYKDVDLESETYLQLYTKNVNAITSSNYIAKYYYDTSATQIQKGTLRIIFFGQANLIKEGVYVVASGQNYSYSFTDGRYYLTRIGADSYPVKNLKQYSGRQGDANKSALSTVLNQTDKLVFMGFGTGTSETLWKFFNNHNATGYDLLEGTSDNEALATYRDYERNTKFFVSFRVERNEVNATVNSYLYNDILPSNSGTYTGYYDYTTNSTSFKVGAADLDNPERDKTHLISIQDSSKTSTYQKDDPTKKTSSWFNDVVLTNLYIQPNMLDANTKFNWQDIYDSSQSLHHNIYSYSIFGYGITYEYYEIPGYYLEYITLKIKEHGTVLIKVPDKIKTGSTNVNCTIGGNARDKEQYTISINYSADNAKFTVNIYKTGDSKEDYYSAAVLANDIELSFFSMAYRYNVFYYYYSNNVQESNISSSATKKFAGGLTIDSNTGAYSQNIYYDTLTKLNGSATMDGYTFIGWGSQYYYEQDLSNPYRDGTTGLTHRMLRDNTTGLITWNTASSWYSVSSYFNYENRDLLYDLITYYANANSGTPGTAFYVNGSNFVTDTGCTERVGFRENYNFWANYIYEFTGVVGNYLEYAGKSNDSTKFGGISFTDCRNIELYGIWKANTYAIQFNTSSINETYAGEEFAEHTSRIYFDYISTGGYGLANTYQFETELLANKLGFVQNGTTYYAYITFDTNLWYITTDPNYSYSADPKLLSDDSNMLDFIVDRYGYSWLGWFGTPQVNEIRYNFAGTYGVEIGRLDATFASKYYNTIKAISAADKAITPFFDHGLYDANGLKTADAAFVTNTFKYFDHNSDVTNTIYHYSYANPENVDFDSENIFVVATINATKQQRMVYSPDYLNAKSLYNAGTDGKLANSGEYSYNGHDYIAFIAYYDTVLSGACYSVEQSETDANVYLVKLNKDAAIRVITLYSYWETNKYNVVFDWEDKSTSNSLNHLGSTDVMSSTIAGTSNNYFWFNDLDLDKKLRELTPLREGYDFIGWTFNYIPEGSSLYYSSIIDLINKPTKAYYLNETLLQNYNSIQNTATIGIGFLNSSILFTKGDLVDRFDVEMKTPATSTITESWLLNNYYDATPNDAFTTERLGYDLSYSNTNYNYYVYIFALWRAQTFSANVALNIDQEELENLYEIDSNFAVALYSGGEGERYSSSVGVSSKNYLFETGVSYNDIIANVAFEIEFDQPFSSAKVQIGAYEYGLLDLFATSAGYYFLGLLYDNSHTYGTIGATVSPNYLIRNTLYSVWGLSGVVNENSSGASYYYNSADATDLDYDPMFDHDFYHKLYTTNHKDYDKPQTPDKLGTNNYNHLAGQSWTEASLNNWIHGSYASETGVDFAYGANLGYSSNFGYLNIQLDGEPSAKRYYIASEVNGANTSLYITINGNKYNVVYYQYRDNSAGGSVNTITFDRTFLYYNEGGSKYKIHFAVSESSGDIYSYYVKDDFKTKVNIKLRVALYNVNATKGWEENKRTVSYITDADGNTIIDTGLIYYNSDFGGVGQNAVGTDLVGSTFELVNKTTRQFTLYCHWENKILDLNMVNNSSVPEEGAPTSDYNYGLSGYYHLEDMVGGRNNQKYTIKNPNLTEDLAKPSHKNVSINDQGRFEFETSTEQTSNDVFNINYYNDVQFMIMPYFNGRYLSELQFEFDDLLEMVNANGTSEFRLVKRILTLKFTFDNVTRNLYLTSVVTNFTTPTLHDTVYYIDSSKDYRKNYFDYLFKISSDLSIIDAEALSYTMPPLEEGQSEQKITDYPYGENQYVGGGFRIFEYLDRTLDQDLGEYVVDYDYLTGARTNINILKFGFEDIMSSINVKCKFSVQTYQVNLYSVANEEGVQLEKAEYTDKDTGIVYEDYYYAPAYESNDMLHENSNGNPNKILTLGAPYKSSSEYGRTNVATIKADCSNSTSTAYNIPYGYYLYGNAYNLNYSPYRPIDDLEVYSFYNAMSNVTSGTVPTRLTPEQEVRPEYKNYCYGYWYIYGEGYYTFGATEKLMIGPTDSEGKVPSSSYVTTNYYKAQCSAALGSISLGESGGIRLQNLSNYAFSGWYEMVKDKEGKDILFEENNSKYIYLNEYSLNDEGSYIYRNLDLYGYYYNADQSVSVSFYYWDNDQKCYLVYEDNKEIYTLRDNSDASGYEINEALNIIGLNSDMSDLEREAIYNRTQVALFNINTSFGARLEDFKTPKYTAQEFNVQGEDDFIEALIDTLWFYYTKYEYLYILVEEGGKYYRYFAQEVVEEKPEEDVEGDASEEPEEPETGEEGEEGEQPAQADKGLKFRFVKEGTTDVFYNFGYELIFTKLNAGDEFDSGKDYYYYDAESSTYKPYADIKDDEGVKDKYWTADNKYKELDSVKSNNLFLCELGTEPVYEKSISSVYIKVENPPDFYYFDDATGTYLSSENLTFDQNDEPKSAYSILLGTSNIPVYSVKDFKQGDYNNHTVNTTDADTSNDQIKHDYIYNFKGANLYVKYDNRYYKLHDLPTSKPVDGRDDLLYGKSRFYAEIGGKVYYLVAGGGSSAYQFFMNNGSGALVEPSDADRLSGSTIEILKNYLVKYDDKYYPIQFKEFKDAGNSTYCNPYNYVKTNKLNGNIAFVNLVVLNDYDNNVHYDLYFDYATGILYTDQEFVNTASTDLFKIYCPLNENFTINYECKENIWSTTTVNLTKLPSTNSTEWYNDERYGFVCYIKTDKASIKAMASADDGIYGAFRKYIEANPKYTPVLDYMMADLQLNIEDYIASGQFFLSFITVNVDKYSFDISGNIIKVEATIPVSFKFYNYVQSGSDYIKVDAFYITLLCPVVFDVINDDTIIDKELYAVPIFAPYVVEFTKDSISYDSGDTSCKITVDVDEMEVSYYEVTSESTVIYDKKNDNYLRFALLDESQYKFFTAITTSDYASNLTLLINQGLITVQENEAQDISTVDIVPTSTAEGAYYLVAFYYKKGKDYIVRVSDNVAKINIKSLDGDSSILSHSLVVLP